MTRERCGMSGVTLHQKAATRSSVYMMAGVENMYIEPTWDANRTSSGQKAYRPVLV